MTPKLEYLINVGTSPDGKIAIDIDANFNDARENLFRRIIDTQELATRNALIQLGWTPPDVNMPRPAPEVEVSDRQTANHALELSESMAVRRPTFALQHYALPALRWALLRIACLEADTTPMRNRADAVEQTLAPSGETISFRSLPNAR